MRLAIVSFLTILLSGGLLLTRQQPAGLLTPMPAETQLTHDAWGHTLNNTQVFSPDDQWVVYDTRNLDTELGKTCCVRMLNLQTGEDRLLYKTQNQTEHGPGVGAATFSPTRNRVLFLQGLRNADAQQPYAMTRRTGVAIDIDQPRRTAFSGRTRLNAALHTRCLAGRHPRPPVEW